MKERGGIGGFTCQMFVSWPRSDWPYEFLGMNFCKAGFFEIAFEERPGARLHFCCSGGFDEFMVELETGVLGGEGSVWGLPCQIKVYELGI